MFADLNMFALQAAPAMPVAWVAGVIFALLLLAAIIDGWRGIVPDPLIFCGLVIGTAAQGLAASWPLAGQQLRLGGGAYLIVWAINIVWQRLFHRAALGMGDAKWSVLAVACFGIGPGLFAWGFGSVLAVICLLALRLARRPQPHLHFAPFLMIGLSAGIYWLRFR